MNTKQLTNFIFEAALVKRVERTGWQFFGDNSERVGEHSFMTAVIAYCMGKHLKANIETILVMSIFHDFHESRTGEFDKVMKYYATRHTEKANKDIFSEVDPQLYETISTYEKRETMESNIVYEANIIAFLVELKLLHEKGNTFAQEWYERNALRLRLPLAKELSNALWETSSQQWWSGIREKILTEYKK